MNRKTITAWKASITPIEPLTIDPIHEVDDDWFDGDDIAESIARAIEDRAAFLLAGGDKTVSLVDDTVRSVFAVCAAIARAHK